MNSLITWKVIVPFEISLPDNTSDLVPIKFYLENHRKKYTLKTLLKPSRNVIVHYWNSSLTGVNWPGSTELRKDVAL